VWHTAHLSAGPHNFSALLFSRVQTVLGRLGVHIVKPVLS
jgi:hypothetical protein